MTAKFLLALASTVILGSDPLPTIFYWLTALGAFRLLSALYETQISSVQFSLNRGHCVSVR
jgi:hypothetical protein